MNYRIYFTTGNAVDILSDSELKFAKKESDEPFKLTIEKDGKIVAWVAIETVSAIVKTP